MDCSLADFTSTLERLGLPIALLAIIIFGMYKVFQWIAPRIDAQLADNKRVQEERLKVHDTMMQESLRLIQRNTEAVSDVMQLLKKMSNNLGDRNDVIAARKNVSS